MILLALILTLVLPVRAQSQFETSYKTVYDIDDSGTTQVDQEITIVNKTDDVLATTYAVAVRQMDIFDVSAKDTAGDLEIDVKRDSESDKTTITIQLKEKVIGKDRSNTINLSYKTNDLANKVGTIWNVNLPKTANLEDVPNYDIELIIPTKLGPKIFLSPTPSQTEEKENAKVYFYTKERLGNESVNGAFGENQVLNFELKYHLRNDRFLPAYQIIALPPDIKNQQEMFYDSIEPAPKSITRDADGNVLARYFLYPNRDLEIKLRGSAKTYGKQINPDLGGRMHEIPNKLRDLYTTEQKYWETGQPQIKDKAMELFDPQKTISQNAFEVYKFITETLEYDYDIVNAKYIDRQGALKALTTQKSWACMEFTDLFIALTRAMGIPARELNGYALAVGEVLTPVSVDLNDGDLLHSWAEFYDPNFGWVPVDPTWGTTSGVDYFTKLDTNHLAFVVKGLDSETPYPAGSYRLDLDDKQINVDFAEGNRSFEPLIEVKTKFPWNLIKLIQGKRPFQIKSSGGSFMYNIAGRGKTLSPFGKRTIYLDKDVDSFVYKNFNGTEKVKALN